MKITTNLESNKSIIREIIINDDISLILIKGKTKFKIISYSKKYRTLL